MVGTKILTEDILTINYKYTTDITTQIASLVATSTAYQTSLFTTLEYTTDKTTELVSLVATSLDPETSIQTIPLYATTTTTQLVSLVETALNFETSIQTIVSSYPTTITETTSLLATSTLLETSILTIPTTSYKTTTTTTSKLSTTLLPQTSVVPVCGANTYNCPTFQFSVDPLSPFVTLPGSYISVNNDNLGFTSSLSSAARFRSGPSCRVLDADNGKTLASDPYTNMQPLYEFSAQTLAASMWYPMQCEIGNEVKCLRDDGAGRFDFYWCNGTVSYRTFLSFGTATGAGANGCYGVVVRPVGCVG